MSDFSGKSDENLPLSEEGTVEKLSLGYVLTFNRRLNHSVQEVWNYLTQPAKLNTWLANAEIELSVGGIIELQYENTGYAMTGKIISLHAPAYIEYSWNGGDEPESVVRWEFKALGDKSCMLTLIHTFEHKCDLPKILSGWHVHLDMLPPAMNDKPIAWSWERWELLRDKYAVNNHAF